MLCKLKDLLEMILTQETIKEVSQNEYIQVRKLHLYEKGEEIPLIAPGLWQVYQGIVQLSTIHLNGEEVLLGWAVPNTCFGSWLKVIPTYQAKALSKVYLKWFSWSDIETSPNLAYALFTQLGRRMQQTEKLLALSGLRPVEERLWQLLLLLKQEMGQPVAQGKGTRLVARLTHQNLADAICTNRVTVTRMLRDFKSRDKITFDSDRHIIIKDNFVYKLSPNDIFYNAG